MMPHLRSKFLSYLRIIQPLELLSGTFRDQTRLKGLHQTPFDVSRVAGIANAFARGAPMMLGCPHAWRS